MNLNINIMGNSIEKEVGNFSPLVFNFDMKKIV